MADELAPCGRHPFELSTDEIVKPPITYYANYFKKALIEESDRR